MNISNIILSLQEKISSSDGSLDLMTYGKIIEKLKVGAVRVADTFSDLPDVSDDGNLFLVKSEQELFYNIGATFISLAKLTPGIAYGWGRNNYGLIGDNTAISKSSPVTVAGGIDNWTQVSAFNIHHLGISGGIAYAWGNNNNGRLGDNTTSVRSSPVRVAGGITNWSQVAAGDGHSLGIAGGIAYAWASNSAGQLGDNTTTIRSSPVTVVGGITNWSQVSAGGSHSLGITESGVLYAWGNNNNGRLGDNTISNQSSPVTVVGGITNWSQVSAGSSHSLGLTDTGVLYAWGLNSSGELGDGTTISKSSPVTVAGGITNWSQIDASDNNNLAIAGGIAYAWGPNNSGQLGTNSTVARSSPVTVVGGITNWSQVSAGRSHSLGLTDTGVLYAWGSNFYGKLGDGTTNNRSSPVTVVGGLTNWSQVAASIDNSIAINISVKSFTQ